MENLNDPINPNEYSGTELLKLMYRDIQLFRTEFDEYKKTNNHSKDIQDLRLEMGNLRNELGTERKLREENARFTRAAIGVAGFIIVAAEFILKIVFKQ